MTTTSMPPTTDVPDDHDLPPSALLVLRELELAAAQGEALSQTELAERSRLTRRTVKYALRRLKTVDLVTEQVVLSDARRREYTLAASEGEVDSS